MFALNGKRIGYIHMHAYPVQVHTLIYSKQKIKMWLPNTYVTIKLKPVFGDLFHGAIMTEVFPSKTNNSWNRNQYRRHQTKEIECKRRNTKRWREAKVLALITIADKNTQKWVELKLNTKQSPNCEKKKTARRGSNSKRNLVEIVFSTDARRWLKC